MMDPDFREKVVPTPFEDERVWATTYGQYGPTTEDRLDTFEAVASEYVERVEQSIHAVGHVERYEWRELGPGKRELVILAFVIAEGADKQILDRVFQEVDHQIRTDVAEWQREREDDD